MRKLKTQELNRKSIEEYKNTPKLPFIVVLDNIRSMYNVGAIFRTSDAFLLKEIILCGITSKPPHREIHKTAIGATESVDWSYFEDVQSAISHLKQRHYLLLGLEQTDKSIPLHNFIIEPDQKYALILGNEINGISDSIIKDLDFCVDIPQYGTKHSLNVSIAGGILIYNLTQQLLST